MCQKLLNLTTPSFSRISYLTYKMANTSLSDGIYIYVALEARSMDGTVLQVLSGDMPILHLAMMKGLPRMDFSCGSQAISFIESSRNVSGKYAEIVMR